MTATTATSTTGPASTSGAAGDSRGFRLLTTTIARVLFALPFAIFGLFHLLKGPAMAGLVPVPGGVFWVYLTGIAMIAGALGVISGVLGRWAALGLALLLAIFVVTIHLPGLRNPAMQQMAMMSLLKDLGLCGGALALAGTLDRPRR